jgi:hypothetical protein
LARKQEFLQDAYVPLQLLVPPFSGLSDHQIGRLSANTFLPLDVAHNKQYLLSLRHGTLLQRGLLLRLLRGELHPGHAASEAGAECGLHRGV